MGVGNEGVSYNRYLLVDSSDYTEVTARSQTLEEFNKYQKRHAIDVTIFNDSTLEDIEMFNVSLGKYNLPKRSGTVTIQIVDDDCE